MKQITLLWRKYHVLSLTFLLAIAISTTLSERYIPPAFDGVMLLFVGSLVALFRLIDEQKRNPLLYISIGMVGLLGICFCRYFNWQPIEAILSSVKWVASYDGSIIHYENKYVICLQFMLSVLATLIAYFVCKLGKWQMLVDCFVIILVGLCLWYKWPVPKMGAIALMSYLLVELSQVAYLWFYQQKQWQRAKYTATFLTPIFVIVLCIVTALPIRSTPIKWEMVKHSYRLVKEQVVKWRFQLSNSLVGFSEEVSGGLFNNGDGETLGGDLAVKDVEWMRVRMDDKTHEPLYLAAGYKQYYEDNKWQAAEDKNWGIEEYRLDTYEYIYSLMREEDLVDWFSMMRQRTLDVNYKELTTNAVFTPPKTKEIISEKKKVSYEQKGILFENVASYDTTYRSAFLELNLQSPRLIRMLQSADNFTYEDLDFCSLGIFKTRAMGKIAHINQYDEEDSKINLNEVLKERADYIEATYTQLPENFSPRVQDLARKITKECTNDYDRLMAIKKYLSQYTYTTRPGGVPKDKELVDYFLFEGQQGYCTYFATAMVMMGRSLGIPMRYVEGAIVDYQKTEKEHVYSINSSKAHAWSEAYFKGIGWIKIEATPGYGDVQYILWPKERLPEEKAKEEQETPDIPDVVPVKPGVEESKEEENVEKVRPIEMIKKICFVCLSVLIAITIALVAFYVFVKQSYRHVYKKSDNTKKFTLLFYELLDHLSACKVGLSEGETLLQLEGKIEKALPEVKEELYKVIETYLGLRYGRKVVSTDQVSELHKICTAFLDRRIKVQGRIRGRLNYIRKQYQHIRSI